MLRLLVWSIPAVFFLSGVFAELSEHSARDISHAQRASAPRRLFRRQNNANSTCNAFGIDFVDGGSYFINSLSTAPFTAVSQFSGCNNDTASILLVNDQTSDEYQCSSVPTVPDNTPELSTCPISKGQMITGNWSILVIGNNGNGNPFAYQRDFFLTVAPQQTVAVTSTVTYNQTITPTFTVTATSMVTTISTISNSLTVTIPSATHIKTITPPAVTLTTTSYITRTFRRWTKTQSKVTALITASCTIPPRPFWPDPRCHILPTAIPLPSGLHIDLKKRDAAPAPGHALKRSADAATLTTTASFPTNTTSTFILPATTLTDTHLTTSTVLTTPPPATVHAGQLSSTVTLPASTTEITVDGYSVTYVTRTMSVTWTYTTTTTPAASASACRARGGHFGEDLSLG